MTINYKKTALIAFDFDGVIVDSLQHNIKITNAACCKFGALRDVTVEDLQKIDRMAFYDVAKLIGVPEENFKPCLDLINQQLVTTYNSLIPFPGIEESLHILSESSLHLIIVTHNTEFAVNAFLKKQNMSTYFTMVMGAETKGEKSAKLASAAKEFQILPEEMIMIGDSAGDIRDAVKAGALPVGVAWGFQKPDKLLSAGAVKILNTPDEIAEFSPII